MSRKYLSVEVRKRGWLLAKWCLFAAVMYFVVLKVTRLWDPAILAQRPIAWPWLVASGVAYMVGWLPCVWFWQRIMQALGSDPRWSITLRAYYLGHLGKYVPGKAAAVLIRTSMLKAEKVPVSVTMISVVLETLGTMGVGLGVGVALAPFVLPTDVWHTLPSGMQALHEQMWLGPVLVTACAIAFVSLGTASLIKLAVRLSGSGLIEAAQSRALGRVLLCGVAALIPTWLLHGLSLGLVLESVGSATWTWHNYLVWTGAIGAGSSLGFFVLFAPGGLGVREGLLMTFLQTSVGGPVAVLAAGLLRLVWLLAELLVAAVLMLWPISKGSMRR